MVEYNPFSEEVMRDPHPVYARLREEAPAYYIEEYDAWALSRFEDIWNASMDAEAYSAAKGTTSAHVLTKVQPVTPMLNLMDPPEHTTLRAKFRPFFLPGRIGKLEPLIRELAVRLLEEKREAGEIDVMGELSSRVATTVACTVTGIPLADADLLNDLVYRFFKREPGIEGMTPDGLAAMEELFGYFIGLAQERRKKGGDDDIVQLLVADDLGLDDAAIASHLSMLIIGGSETFPKVFANCMRWLGEHPDQRAACAKDPALLPDAFIEVLRYDMPTQFLCRTLKKDVALHGHTLKAGQPVLFLYPAAHRDPREFENPDSFDIHRRPPRILSFGHGTHLCLGIHAAKLEGRVLLEETLARIPEYRVEHERAERLVTDFVQGYAALPVSFEPF